MKRMISCLLVIAGFTAASAASAEAGLLFGHRVVYRPRVVRTVVVAPPAPVLVAPVQPVSRVVYTPGYYAPAYYVPAAPVYVGGAVAPVYVGW